MGRSGSNQSACPTVVYPPFPLCLGQFCFGFYFSFWQIFLGAFTAVVLKFRDSGLPNQCSLGTRSTPYTRSFEQRFHLVCDLLDVFTP